MKTIRTKIMRPGFLVSNMLAIATFATTALAGEHAYGPYPAYYSEECGSCHVPYPPQRMTQAGWEIQMKNLKQHFGSDASVDVPASQTILSYLVNNAGWKDKLAPTEPTARITKTSWFVKEHGAAPPKGKPFSDCTQCHTQAIKGDYSERTLKSPSGWRKGG